jgi:hypothetical protein
MPARLVSIGGFTRSFRDFEPDWTALRDFERPVYNALGGRSNQELFGRIADRLAGVFPDFTLEVFADRHHFDPPHRIEPARLASSLRGLWTRAEAGEGGGIARTTRA